MVISDYLVHGQIVAFSPECGDTASGYLVRIETVSDEGITALCVDTSAARPSIAPGTKGHLRGTLRGAPYTIYTVIESLSASSVMLLKPLPSRTYMRVNALMHFSFAGIPADELAGRKKTYCATRGNDRTDHGDYTGESEKACDADAGAHHTQTDIADALRTINKKLNFIILHICSNRKQPLFGQEPVAVNISGAGIRFESGHELQVNEYIEGAMLLPPASGALIFFIGRVVRCCSLRSQQKGDKRFEIAACYEDIDDDDRECIVRYVMNRQRELLMAAEQSEKTV